MSDEQSQVASKSQGPRAAAREPAVGDVLGLYQLEELAGEGGMGRVFRARRLADNKTVALKVLRSKYAARPEAISRFFAEARAITVISHPNIIAIIDYFDGGPKMVSYFVMEWLTGESLAQYLARRGSLNQEEVAHIGRQVASALAAVHEEGFVHRDIKPDNIFLLAGSGEVTVKLLDFGVAVLEGTGAGVLVGAPAYFSPECAAGRSLDARSDIYSLGAVIYELLAGCPPFIAKSLAEYAMKHMTEPPRPLAQAVPSPIQPCLARVVDRCLAKDPRDRFQSMEELALALSDTKEPAPLWWRKWWWILAIMVVAILLVVAMSWGRHGVAPGISSQPQALPQPLKPLLAPAKPAWPSLYEVKLQTLPAGAAVFKQGALIGTTPCVVHLPRGAVRVDFILNGYQRRSELLQVALGAAWQFTLEKDASRSNRNLPR